MSYTSIAYLGFILMGSFFFYSIVPLKHKWKVLLIFSYLFYFINSGKYIVFILFSTLSIYFGGLLLNKIDDGFSMAKKALPKENKKEFKSIIGWQKKCVCVSIVLLNLGILVYLKYSVFFGQVFCDILSIFHIKISNPMQNMMLPLGISFYTLSAISYIVDVYRGKYKASDNLGKVALFLVFFPHIVEGPIGRFDLLGDQVYEGHPFDYKNATMGLQLVFWGLFKKIVIADRANMYVNQIFNFHDQYDGLYVIIGMLLYTLQLYAEFSGCMDIVRGSAQMFGIELSENFARPFMSKTVSEFWRRWHMTLGAWFKDYVFYTISLSKAFMKLSKKTREKFNAFFATLIPTSIAMLAVWFGTGIWHGASWKYVMYGIYYCLIMILGLLTEPLFRKLFEKMHVNREGKIYKALQVVRTFIFVNIGMLMFRADDLKIFGQMFISMFRNLSWDPIRYGELFDVRIGMSDFLLLLFGAIVLLLVGLYQEQGRHIREDIATKNIVFRWVLYYGLIFSVIILGAYGSGYEVAGFIYAQF
ncbi:MULTISPECIES: MBOAT family O-acyltransferase [Coprococcus]|jgi:alginate O-acetyltransferase complex protein AlgI|uniref:MBOAT family O-acyltransferase n=1 Tax=Coprococcus ammoniilyticus TaxID=2981785 RepID=A0ABV1EI45_9FIRM|nr:MBOAT family protein [Coprococcus sp.]